MLKFFTISNAKELYRLPVDSIIYVSGDGDYSDIMMADGKPRTVTCQLGHIDEMLTRQLGTEGRNLVRIGKSIIINLDYLVFINPSRKRRIAAGCGMQVEDVNRLLAQHKQMQKMFKQMNSNGKKRRKNKVDLSQIKGFNI